VAAYRVLQQLLARCMARLADAGHSLPRVGAGKQTAELETRVWAYSSSLMSGTSVDSTATLKQNKVAANAFKGYAMMSAEIEDRPGKVEMSVCRSQSEVQSTHVW
jgi:hypothetical protein